MFFKYIFIKLRCSYHCFNCENCYGTYGYNSKIFIYKSYIDKILKNNTLYTNFDCNYKMVLIINLKDGKMRLALTNKNKEGLCI